MARGLLILFKPFRNEKNDIHSKDVKKELSENIQIVESNREKFEKYKLMTELINNIQQNEEEKSENEDEEEITAEEDENIETTTTKEMEDFHSWVKAQAAKDLVSFKDFISVIDI